MSWPTSWRPDLSEEADPLDLGGPLLRRLERLTVHARRPFPGQAAGARRSPRTGSSVEFADFRSYVPGDDFRRVDWNAYGRLDRLMLRLYHAEEDVCLTLWLDTSASMRWGTPDKSRFARRVAGGLAYAALTGFDRVGAAGFADDGVRRMPPLRGRAAAPRLWRFIADLDGGGRTSFSAIARAPRPLPGISVIISDFLDEDGPEPALAALRGARQDVLLLQVLAPQELNPELSGDIELEDIESSRRVEMTVTPAVVASYRAALEQHTERLAALARAYGAGYEVISTDQPLDALLTGEMRRLGILR